jgi:hypothetical protein
MKVVEERRHGRQLAAKNYPRLECVGCKLLAAPAGVGDNHLPIFHVDNAAGRLAVDLAPSIDDPDFEVHYEPPTVKVMYPTDAVLGVNDVIL